MRRYIADCHFWHQKLNDCMDHRGFANVEEMNDHMVKQWNSVVSKRDEVVILGDFSWGDWEQTESILDRLNGRLFLIRGNHDRFLKDKNFDPSRFEWIRDYAELNDNRKKIILSHYPIACYNGQYRRGEDGIPRTWMLHGHIHSTRDQTLLDRWQEMVQKQKYTAADGAEESIPCQFINCFCQLSDYKPLTLDEWIETDRKRRQALSVSLSA